MKVPLTELFDRQKCFRARMDRKQPGWELAAITGKAPLYYFTGTMQDGLLLIPHDGDAIFWVRQSFDRAAEESLFPNLRKMRSYRDIAAGMGHLPSAVYLETDLVPGMLREGFDEVTFGCDLYSLMVKEGHQGIIRFGCFNEMLLGQIGFGTSSICPICVDTPGGVAGMHPSAPQRGSRDRKLRKGDLVVIDIGCGYRGYHTDKTMTYMFGGPIPEYAIEAHFRCVAIQDKLASMLRPGAIPQEIYRTVMADLEPEFLRTFMGSGKHRVSFLGHGIGLWIDELPVIAEGFIEPLEEGMILALEPKKGIADIGLVGIENTFAVTPQGGRSLTGKSRGLVEIY